jgi:hypothetical protein
MARSDLLVMDLRAFAPGGRGVIFELGVLLDEVALHRVVLLVDHTTDLSHLQNSLSELWARVEPHSPNIAAISAGAPRVRIIDLASGYPAAVSRLMQFGDEVLAAA